jgi:hypothetical protein
MTGQKSVYVAYVGGTIGMVKTPTGYRPERGFLQAQLATLPELKDERMPRFSIRSGRGTSYVLMIGRTGRREGAGERERKAIRA